MTTQTKTIWRVAKLGEVVIPKGSVSGPFGSNIHSKFFTHEGVPVIRGNNLAIGFHPGRYVDDDYIFLSGEKADELSKSEALPEDIIVTARGTIGQTGIIPKKSQYKKYILSANQLRFRIDRKVADPLFVYYWLASKRMVKMMQNISVNVGVPNLNLGNTRNLPVPTPPLPTQEKIADILSAFDDKIELNNKISRTLEQMAQTIFKEWFVNFKFPGHEKIKMVDSELGKIPEGWEVKSLDSVVELDKGLSYKGSGLAEKGMPMINLGCFLRGGQFSYDNLKYYVGDYKPRHIAQVGDLLVSNTDITQEREIIGNPVIVEEWLGNRKYLFTHHIYIFRPKSNLNKIFLYYLLRQSAFRARVIGAASGTNILGLSKESISSFEIIVPPVNLVEKITDVSSQILEKMSKIKYENQKLSALRDLLLPKLMSGEIRV